jgi:hypothetical protein
MQLLLCWHCQLSSRLLLLCLAVDAAAGLLCMQLPQSCQLLQQADVLLLPLLQCCLVALLLLLQLPGCCLLNHASYGDSTWQCSSLEGITQQVQQANHMSSGTSRIHAVQVGQESRFETYQAGSILGLCSGHCT